MAWVKRGRIFQPDTERWWSRTHAQVPVAELVSPERLRLYYAGRDDEGRAHTSFVEVDAEDPGRLLYAHDRPLLEHGRPGAFDDSGVMPAWALRRGGRTWLYYTGWTTRGTVPYQNAIGLMVSDDGTEFHRWAEGPLFGPTPEEPYFTGTACVVEEGGLWRCWYLDCVGWFEADGRLEPRYDLKYAESDDGVAWRRGGRVAIPLASEEEGGLAKASVVRDGDLWRMWYCRRGVSGYREAGPAAYRLGYAESPDGVRWTRMDDRAGVDVSEEGWDAEMVAYPHVIDAAGRRYLFYNGNGFGWSGFGYAVWEDDA